MSPRETPDVIEADVCIIGAGPAGLAIFTELDRTGVDVCLVESGGMYPAPETQALCGGESAGEPYPFESTRVRAFGGTSHLWTGICAPPDEADLAKWPLSRAELGPFLDRAMRFFGLPPLAEAESARPPAPPNLDDRLELKPLYFPAELRVGAARADQARRSRTGRVLLGAAVTELTPSADGARVETARARTLGGREILIRAQRYVVATGGLEAPRLLAASEAAGPNGLGARGKPTGRCFMERRHIVAGEWAPREHGPVVERLLAERSLPGGNRREALALKAAVREREGAAGCWLRIYPLHESEGSEAVAAHQRLWVGWRTRERPLDVATLLRNWASDPVAVARYYGWKAARRFAPRTARPPKLVLAVTVEQQPRPENRVTLSPSRDALGSPLTRLELSDGEHDRRTLERSVELFAEALGSVGDESGEVTRFTGEPWPRTITNKYGAHHMGATRIDDSPERGVVDRDCRVHGTENLWIASSSVFPTAGAANPTLLIVALAIRIAGQVSRS